jgi:capsular polysaccharide biosynthesis protein
MYYHWFHDVLPRLENAIKYLPDNTRFLINEKPYEYQIKSLEAYGISIDKLEYQSPKLHTKIQNLWFATPVGHEKFGSIKTIKKVVHRIKKHFNINNISRDQNIYISRKNAISRRVVNEKQITNIISSRGYDIYYVDEMTWVKQVELFSNAASIIGPHGGGFTNMIFSNLKTNIHEIAPANHSWPYYQLLSAQLGHSFSRINASTDSSGNRANLIVDIIDLTKSLG